MWSNYWHIGVRDFYLPNMKFTMSLFVLCPPPKKNKTHLVILGFKLRRTVLNCPGCIFYGYSIWVVVCEPLFIENPSSDHMFARVECRLIFRTFTFIFFIYFRKEVLFYFLTSRRPFWISGEPCILFWHQKHIIVLHNYTWK